MVRLQRRSFQGKLWITLHIMAAVGPALAQPAAVQTGYRHVQMSLWLAQHNLHWASMLAARVPVYWAVG